MNKNFDDLEIILREQWIGSIKDISALSKAFERPYVRGYDKFKTRSAMLIIGPESRGKVYGVRCISNIMKKKMELKI